MKVIFIIVLLTLLISCVENPVHVGMDSGEEKQLLGTSYETNDTTIIHTKEGESLQIRYTGPRIYKETVTVTNGIAEIKTTDAQPFIVVRKDD